MKKNITSKTVLHKYENVYVGNISGLVYVHKPRSQKGVVVLTKITSDVYKLIDGKKSINEIWKTFRNKHPASYKSFIAAIKILVASEIIYSDLFQTKQAQDYVHEVWFHITNACNLRCKYCYINKTQSKMDTKTALLSLNKIISNAKTYGYKYLRIKFSGGEPLLELPLIKILVEKGKKYAKKNNIYVKFKILTNGVLITKEVAKFLFNENIEVMVSMDGIGKYNDIQRVFPSGVKTSPNIIGGIRNLQKKGVPFSISAVITSKNVIDMPNFTKYLVSINVPFSFSFYRASDYSTDLYKPDNKILIQYMKKSYKIISQSNPNKSLLFGLLDKVGLVNINIAPCNIVINHDGSIGICQMMMDEKIGSIYDADDIFRKINQKRMERFKLNHNRNNNCLTCLWKNICSGGCPLTTAKMNYSVYCEVYKSLIPYLLKLEAKRVLKNNMNFLNIKKNKHIQ